MLVFTASIVVLVVAKYPSPPATLANGKSIPTDTLLSWSSINLSFLLSKFIQIILSKNIGVCLKNGKSLKEIYLGPVLAGPSVSRGRVYIGTGNTHFTNSPKEAYFPKNPHGTIYSFGLPFQDEVDRMGTGKE